MRSLIGDLTRRRAEIIDFVIDRVADPSGRRAAGGEDERRRRGGVRLDLTEDSDLAGARTGRLRRPHHAGRQPRRQRGRRLQRRRRPRGDRLVCRPATRSSRRGRRQRARDPRGAARGDLRARLLHQARGARRPRDRPPAGAADLHPARRQRRGRTRATRTVFSVRLPYSALQGVRVIDVLVVDDDFMVAQHPRAVRRAHRRASRSSAAPAPARRRSRSPAELRARPGAARRAPARHERARRARRAARRRQRRRGVVMVTAERDADAVRTALHGGAMQYLVKPFEYDDLAARLRRVAGGTRHAGVRGDRPGGDRPGSSAAPRHRSGRVGPCPRGSARRPPTSCSAALREAGELSAAECAGAGRALAGHRAPLPRALRRHRRAPRCGCSYGGAGRPERRYRARRSTATT